MNAPGAAESTVSTLARITDVLASVCERAGMTANEGGRLTSLYFALADREAIEDEQRSAERELLLAVADYVLDTYQPTRAEKAERIRGLMERMAGLWDTDTE